MKKLTTGVVALATVATITTFAMSQPPRGRGGPGGRTGAPPNALLEILDANEDREVSATEIENATTALKKLDRNGDGKLAGAELRPVGGPGGPDRRGPGGPAAGARGRPGGDNSTAFLERVLSFDENGDGKIAKSELPERMQGIVDRHDKNEDGSLDKSELEQIAQRGPSRPEGRQGGRGGPGGDRGGREVGGPGGRGVPSPDQFAEHAMSFDFDEDGKLSREELKKLAEEFASRGPGRGRGGPGGRGRRGGQPGGGQRPPRASRPDSE